MVEDEKSRIKDEVRARLIGEAKKGESVSYKELVIIMGHENPERGDYPPLWPLLDDITKDEVGNGRPMLCSVAIKTGRTYPGGGFYRLARELKYIEEPKVKKPKEDRDFWRAEREKDRDFWRSKREETWAHWSTLDTAP